MTYVYLVCVGRRMATGYNNRQAIRTAKLHPGAEVYRMPYRQYHDPSCLYGWDLPTFRMLSERIY